MKATSSKQKFLQKIKIIAAIAIAYPIVYTVLLNYVEADPLLKKVTSTIITLAYIVITWQIAKYYVQYYTKDADKTEILWAALSLGVPRGSKRALIVIALFVLILLSPFIAVQTSTLSQYIEWRKITITDILITSLTLMLAIIEFTRWRRENMPPIVEISNLEINQYQLEITGDIAIVNNSSKGYIARAYLNLPFDNQIEAVFTRSVRKGEKEYILINNSSTSSLNLIIPLSHALEKPTPAILEIEFEESANKTIYKQFPLVIKDNEVEILD